MSTFNDVKKDMYLWIQKAPIHVKSTHATKTGKHGHRKVHVEGINCLTSAKCMHFADSSAVVQRMDQTLQDYSASGITFTNNKYELQVMNPKTTEQMEILVEVEGGSSALEMAMEAHPTFSYVVKIRTLSVPAEDIAYHFVVDFARDE